MVTAHHSDEDSLTGRMQPASQLLLQSDMTQRMPSLSIYMRLQLPISDAALMHEVPDPSHEVAKSMQTLEFRR